MEQMIGSILGLAVGLGVAFIIFRAIATDGFENSPSRKPHRLAHQENFTLSYDLSTSVSTARKALMHFPIKKIRYDDDRKALRALTGMTQGSLGEIITIAFTDKGAQTDVSVQSQPVIPYALTDLGKGQENVNKIRQMMCENK